MSNWVYDGTTPPEVKADNPEEVLRTASLPSSQKYNAADFNNLRSAVTGARQAINDGVFFNVKRYGAAVDNSTDDTTALEETLAAAGAAAQTVAGLAIAKPEVFIPSGGCFQSKPIFVPNGVTLRGAGPGASVLAWKAGTWGYGLLAADSDNGSNNVHISGGALQYDYDGTAATQTFIDLAQYPGGRLPAGNWTIRLAARFTDVLAAGASGLPVFCIGAQTAWSNHPVGATALVILFDPFTADGHLRIQYRYGNIFNDATINTASYGALSNGTWYEIELDYDDAAGTLRVFINGELWTLGAWTPGAAGDGTKFRMWAWERFTIGSVGFSGYPSESFLFPSALGSIKGVHISGVVRHTSGYTASPLTDPTPDGNTRLLVKFDSTYLGHVVATGIGGSAVVYLKPRRQTVTEHPRVQIRDLALLQGAGLRLEFASEGMLHNLLISYPDAGLEMVRNCYFTHLHNVRVLNGARAGVLNEGGAYNVFNAVNVAAKLGFAFTDANVTMLGCESAAHSGASVNLAIQGGTGSCVAFAVDNEENVGNAPWLAAAILANTASYSFTDPTLYSPPDQTAKSPVMVVNTAGGGPTAYNFMGGLFQGVPGGTAFVQLVGDKPDLDQKIVFAGVGNTNSSPLCDVAGQAHDPFERPRGTFQISGVDTTHQVDLPYAGFGTDYEVAVTPVDASAGASAGCTRVRKVAKSDDHFIVTVEAAPGGTETADFDYVVEVAP